MTQFTTIMTEKPLSLLHRAMINTFSSPGLLDRFKKKSFNSSSMVHRFNLSHIPQMCILVALCLGAHHAVWATEFTVSNNNNAGAGSLRQAITNANADPAVPHTINFSIAAGSVITLGAEPLPEITRSMILDATTAAGWSANAVGITLDATENTSNQIIHIADVPNVEIYGFEIVGGLSTSFGILIIGENADGFKIGAVNKRNFIYRAANTIIKVIGADNGFIQNNYLGCDVTGSFGYYGEPLTFPPNSGSGLWLTDGADGNIIGGAQAGEGNLIAGGTGLGILVGLNYDPTPEGLSGCSGNVFYGNRVGGLETLQFYYIAFWIEGNSDNNIIGGVEPGQANDLSYSSNGISADGDGYQVIRIRGAQAQGNTIRGNVMTCGLGAGIGLLTPGANDNQQAPVITGYNSTQNTLSGTSTTPGAAIDVYVGSDCNGNLTDQMKSESYLTSTFADASGNWSVDLSLFLCPINNQFLTATATNMVSGSTGPFSEGFLVSAAVPASELPTASFTYVQSGAYTVQFSNTSSPGCTSFWDFGAGFTSIEDSPSHDFTSSGTWPVQLIVTNDCGSDTLDTTVLVAETGIEDIDSSNLSISEQGGMLILQSSRPLGDETNLSLSNLSGQLIGNSIVATNNQNCLHIPTQQLAPGIYFITLQSPSGQRTLKWLKTAN